MVGSMYSLDPLEGRGPVIAVVGGGASGTLAVIHLLRSAAASQCPLRVVLIDRHGRHGLGQAYSTAHPAHLLNTAAGQMSALAGDPGHLMRWADAAGITHDGFLARHAYGRYLRETLSDAERSRRRGSAISPRTSWRSGATPRARHCDCAWPMAASTPTRPSWPSVTCRPRRRARSRRAPGTSPTRGRPAPWTAAETAVR